MVDNVTIRIWTVRPREYWRTLFTEDPYFTNANCYKFKIGNGNHFITLIAYDNMIKIVGSVRKWWLGKYSVEDLNPSQIVEVCQKLSKILRISFHTVLNGTLLRLEFGKTFLISIPVSYLVSKCFKYSCLTPVIRDTSVKFEGQKFDFIIYDKNKEVLYNMRKDGANLIMSRGDEHWAKNLARIEIDAKGVTGIMHKFGNITSLADVLAHYRIMNAKLLNEIKRIEMKPRKASIDNISFHGNTPKAFYTYVKQKGINAIGERLVFELLSQIPEKTRDYHVRQIKSLIRDFEKVDDYNKDLFWGEIKKQIAVEISRKKEVANFSKL